MNLAACLSRPAADHTVCPSSVECHYAADPVPAPLSAASVPSEDLARMLDAAEAFWRVATRVNESGLYSVADDALTALLIRAFGDDDGRDVRDLMADNFEGWSYNRKIITDRREFEAGLCDDCGVPDYEHTPDCDKWTPTLGYLADLILAATPADRVTELTEADVNDFLNRAAYPQSPVFVRAIHLLIRYGK